ncbi:putative Mitochondrial 2-oxodicarboxylate carrier protein [Taphrina deformans PYCC 5710]|uniref:Mitochondrial 2-oxodicarboxylate carrier protein n=1 Tax=Taphrina deformans (strain PYCC 5710 / ATCC 11124 / CBS 356.35 / IMI 108563 / JCM 9778 / NBRC 8474) TaxID=1097556 RepID=R4XBJ6_TAPDE|nr:putative Mitochondrial 2-oxodicarboxylate carrier protein [Taphrina deformans PYCC 5710]|eukprot:CCG81746.1 putative Mitochondrial 2-oxodicarboxylate carrier protein [Taphrina deformans PYCC 5710]
MDSFAAGAIAGVSEILTMYPLDVVKTRAQLSVGKGEGMIASFRNIIKNEGAATLYRGLSAPIMMEAPKRATKFAANDAWGQFYRNLFGVEKSGQGLSILTGATAGATESFVVVPFELVKIRLQDRKSAHLYNGAVDCVQKIVKQEGLLAMYNGLEATMMRHITWNAGYFGVIFQVKAQLPKPEGKRAELINNFVAGSIGGTVGTILNTPFDVVKSRVQNSPRVAGSVPKYNWSVPSLFIVAKEEGFAALYKGFIPKVLRLGPGGGILLAVYTALMEVFATYK